MRFTQVIDFLEEKKIDHKYVRGWMEAYDDVEFQYDNEEYILESAIGVLSKNVNNIIHSVELDKYDDIYKVFVDLKKEELNMSKTTII